MPYQKIITRNAALFQTGTRLTRRRLCKLFNLKTVVHQGNFADVHRSNLLLVHVQSKINDVLADSGLWMRSENYYSHFYIADKTQTANRVLALQEKSDANKTCSNRLDIGFSTAVKNGTWGTYIQPTASTAVSRVIGRVQTTPPTKSFAYRSKAKRMKRLVP